MAENGVSSGALTGCWHGPAALTRSSLSKSPASKGKTFCVLSSPTRSGQTTASPSACAMWRLRRGHNLSAAPLPNVLRGGVRLPRSLSLCLRQRFHAGFLAPPQIHRQRAHHGIQKQAPRGMPFVMGPWLSRLIDRFLEPSRATLLSTVGTLACLTLVVEGEAHRCSSFHCEASWDQINRSGPLDHVLQYS